MAIAAALPLTPDGSSFLRILARAFEADFFHGIVTLIGYGSPFLFGLGLIVSGLGRTEGLGRRFAQTAILLLLALMEVQLVLAAAILTWQGIGVAPYALLGFGVVSGLYLAYHSALSRAESPSSGGGPSLRWMARWGSMIVIAACTWIRLQWFQGVQFGIAVDLLLVSALLINWQMRPRPVKVNAADSDE
jgi:hypothetical protein